MKGDTTVFATLAMGRHFNFAPENSRGDPFLIQTSVSGHIVAGNRARAIRKGKEAQSTKRCIPLAEDDMSKAKACEEMILYERPISQGKNQASPVNASKKDLGQPAVKQRHPEPQFSALKEFETAVLAYIKDTTLPQSQPATIEHESQK